METVMTGYGPVRGIWEDGLWAYKGIPFAAAPVGERRFRPPVPPQAWKDARDCTQGGMRPWQQRGMEKGDDAGHTYGEDCLNLSVWTPAPDDGKRPVLVYFYGGGHCAGSNSEPGFVPHQLFGGEDFVMVAPNYRLGVLGYTYLAHLLGERAADSGNLGLLDQIAALRWVRENIDRFGGDPKRVTIMGQSAGGKSVACLLCAPSAKGLFRRAILLSGGLQCAKSIETEIELTDNLLWAAGLDREQAGELLTMPLDKIAEAQEKAGHVIHPIESYGATADGRALLKDFLRGLDLRGIEILMGHMGQELYPRAEAEREPLDAQAVLSRLRWKFGANAAHVEQVYRERLEKMGFVEAYGSVMSDYTYVQPFWRTAQAFARAGADVYLYRWDFSPDSTAYHSLDVETLFGVKAYSSAAHVSNVQKARAAWRSMIRDGHPGWPVSTAETAYQMKIDEEWTLERRRYAEMIDERFPLQVMRLPTTD